MLYSRQLIVRGGRPRMSRRGVGGGRRSPAFDPDAVLGAAVGLYETALGGDVIAPALNTLAPHFASRMGAMIRIDRVAGTTVGSHFSGGDVAVPTVYAYTSQDLSDDYLYNATRDFAAGTTYLGSDLLTSDVLRRSPIYHRLVAPQSLEFIVGGLLENSAETYSALGFWRSGEIGNYTDDARKALALAIPHVRNALQVSRRLAEAEGIRREGLEALERARHGVLLLAPGGTVTYLNREAERMVQEDDGVGVREGRLVFADDLAAARSEDLAALAVANGTGDAPAAGRAFPARRSSGRLPYEVLVVPLIRGPGQYPVPGRAAVMVLVTDPLEAFAIPFHRLVDHYRLTPAEARFCRALLAQGSLRGAADCIKVSVNTARTHLKRVFAKVGVQSQSQLFRLFGAGLRN
jgi:DNA-binding CsgD family transcriptional regulator